MLLNTSQLHNNNNNKKKKIISVPHAMAAKRLHFYFCRRNSMSVPLILATLKFLQYTEFLKVFWSVIGGSGERRRERNREGRSYEERRRKEVAPNLWTPCTTALNCWIPTSKHKGWSRQAVRAAPWIVQPPNMGGRVKPGEEEEQQQETESCPPALGLQVVGLLSVFLQVHQHCLQQTHNFREAHRTLEKPQRCSEKLGEAQRIPKKLGKV